MALRKNAKVRYEAMRWPEVEEVESGEPLERRRAVYYAPRGECEYCDRRRAAAARSMRATREREG